MRDELHALQDEFPDKFVQLGFWPVTDNENNAYGGTRGRRFVRLAVAHP